MFVKSLKGTRCPMEDAPREYIDDKSAREVPDSAYYKRLVRDGSLVVVTAELEGSDAMKGGK